MKIFLLANNSVGLQIAKYLKRRGENIVALGIAPTEKQKFTQQIIDTLGLPKNKIIKGEQLSDKGILEKIKKLKPDIIIGAFWVTILKPEILAIPKHGSINFHPGLLPYNRGMNPNVWSFIENTPAGVTLHYIDNGVDTGSIIAQKEIPIGITDTAGDLEKKTWKEIVVLFKKTWGNIKKNRIQSIVQDESKMTFHWAKDIDSLDEIDLDKKYKASELLALLRARSYPKKSFAYFIKDGKKVYVKVSLYTE